jgi:Homocysteine S-methyltransferase
VAWAAEAGADMIIAETFSWLGEALLALEAIQAVGLPAVVTFAVHREGTLRDEPSPAEACRQAEQAGAAVVGLNCIRGPRTMLPLLGQIREAVSCEVAALPVPYRTTEAEPSMQSLHDPGRGGAQAFPTALDPFTCTRHELGEFASEALALGVRYLGVCCGGGGGGQDAPGVPLLAGHDEAFVPRHRSRHCPDLPGVRRQPVGARALACSAGHARRHRATRPAARRHGVRGSRAGP